ncbi:MAG: tetratricopeptide repeat protein, partial [Gemmatimonadetes bacterium]|nr:tetratricopeptide repeat protein [Gemmatimonadota bacterium]
ADIYAIGAVAYELLTGRTPFTGATPQSILAAHVTEQVEPVSKYRDHVTAELEAVIMRCLEKKPADRWQSADELLPHLETVSTPSGGLTPTSTRPMSVASEPVRSSRRPLYIGIGAVVALIAAWGVFGTGSTGGSGASSDLPRLLVLPAQNLGGPEMAYYADGLSEEVSTRLTSLSGLEVIGRFSAEQYRDTDKSPQQIGEELNTEYILSLRVRSGGSTASSPVRVSAELLRASSAVQLWSQSYTAQEMDDLFDMMGDVASNVAAELGLTLVSAEQQTLNARPTDNQEAWNFYLQGTAAYNRSTNPDDYRAAAEHFQRAVELDGGFALAWVGLGEAHLEVHWFDGRRFPERVEMAREAIDRAAQLDPGSFELRRAKGIYNYHGFLDYDRALEEFDAARNIRPNDAEVHAWAAFVYRRQGNMERAAASLERAFELDPRSGFIARELGITRVILGRFSEARSPLRLSIALDPRSPVGNFYLALSFLAEGNLTEAQKVLRTFSEHVPLADLTWWWSATLLTDDELQDRVLTAALSESVPDTGAFYLSKAFLLRARGDISVARVMADSAAVVLQAEVRRVPDAAFSHSSLGIAHAIAGRRDPALENGRRATELLPISADYWDGAERIIDLAQMLLLLGETDVAVPMLRELFDIHQFGTYWKALLRYHPVYDAYREDSSFRALYEE